MDDYCEHVYIVRLRKVKDKPHEMGWLGDNISGASSTLAKIL
jgi:hypothetical protein